jgi:hypothetical protein
MLRPVRSWSLSGTVYSIDSQLSKSTLANAMQHGCQIGSLELKTGMSPVGIGMKRRSGGL